MTAFICNCSAWLLSIAIGAYLVADMVKVEISGIMKTTDKKDERK